MALTKKKSAKKRPAPKRKRKASPAQLAALARGRAKRKAKTGVTKKRKVTKSSSLPVKQERKTMAKKRRSPATTTTKRKRSVKSSFKGIGGRAKKMIPMIKDVGIAVAGGVGANVLVNKLPIANPKLKAALPLIAGLLVSSVLGKKKPMFREIGHGMAVIGAIALLKQFAPNLPMLAGEDDVVYLPEGYQGDMMQLGYDEDPDLMGDLLQLGDESEGYLSPASM